MDFDPKDPDKTKDDISGFNSQSMHRALEDEAFLQFEQSLLGQLLDPHKGLKLTQALSPLERRWVENRLREELELHGLLFLWKWGHRSYSELPPEKQGCFKSEMRSFLKNLMIQLGGKKQNRSNILGNRKI
jgi:hypothetical protein